MAAQHKFHANKSLGRVAIVAIALATLSYTISGALLDRSSWFAADILRLLILRADWHILLPYLFHGSGLVQHFLQFTTCS